MLKFVSDESLSVMSYDNKYDIKKSMLNVSDEFAMVVVIHDV